MNQNTPKEIRKVIKQIKKEHGYYTRETGEAFMKIIEEGGWLYSILCFPVMPPVSNTVLDLNELAGDYATIEYKTAGQRFIPLYTGKDYAENLAEVTHLQNYEYACCRAVTIKSMIEKARECNITGVIINPQIEGITLCLREQKQEKEDATIEELSNPLPV